VLNNQPQGGFLMRRPTVDVPVASGNNWGNDGSEVRFGSEADIHPPSADVCFIPESGHGPIQL
jgi:hypothetical protein